MTNKYIAIVGLVVVVLGLGVVSVVRSGGVSPSYVIENIENWYGGNTEGENLEGNLGAIEMESGRITYDQLATTVLQRRQVVVSAAALDNLQDVPVTLIPAVGTGQVIVVQEIVGFRRFSSESWSRAHNESFEVKWGNSQTASATMPGMIGAVALGASFSNGFLTGGTNNTVASPSVEIWQPSGLLTDGDGSVGGTSASQSYEPGFYASSSAVYLTGNVAPQNAETSGITDFVFEVVYRIFTRP